MNLERRQNKKTPPGGITLIEIMVVVGVIAILAVIAVPALAQIVPYAELRSDTRYVATAMRQARLLAANSHKPVRVAVDCSDQTDSGGCELRSYVAVFYNGDDGGKLGEFREWQARPSADFVHRFADSVTVRDNADLNEHLGAAVTTGENIFWAVFMPSSRVMASHAPFRLTLASRRNDSTQTVLVDGVTGRATVNPEP